MDKLRWVDHITDKHDPAKEIARAALGGLLIVAGFWMVFFILVLSVTGLMGP